RPPPGGGPRGGALLVLGGGAPAPGPPPFFPWGWGGQGRGGGGFFGCRGGGGGGGSLRGGGRGPGGARASPRARGRALRGAAQGLAPEVRQGGGIGGVDGQGCETQVDGGGHDGFPSDELIHRRPRSMYGTSGSGASPRTGPTCPGGQVLVVSAGQGHLSTA